MLVAKCLLKKDSEVGRSVVCGTPRQTTKRRGERRTGQGPPLGHPKRLADKVICRGWEDGVLLRKSRCLTRGKEPEEAVMGKCVCGRDDAATRTSHHDDLYLPQSDP